MYNWLGVIGKLTSSLLLNSAINLLVDYLLTISEAGTFYIRAVLVGLSAEYTAAIKERVRFATHTNRANIKWQLILYSLAIELQTYVHNYI